MSYRIRYYYLGEIFYTGIFVSRKFKYTEEIWYSLAEMVVNDCPGAIVYPHLYKLEGQEYIRTDKYGNRVTFIKTSLL